jgi:anti-sigma regulatory factor (Ser/Thr protein kinase)
MRPRGNLPRQARMSGYPKGVSMPAELLRLRLRCDASAPARARRAISKLAAIDAVRDDALLIVSELATNAVVHSGSAPEEEFELRAELVPSGLRIAVIDPGRSNKTPVPRNGNTRGPGGMGLRVVELLARRWGSERNRQLEVWAELAL